MKLNDIESQYEIILEGDHVIKFDEHRYFRKLSGKGYKGVDYLIINDDYLYLIELKNFQQYKNTPRPSETEINAIFHQKCEDTLRVLELFEAYLNSSWIRRVLVMKYNWFFLGDVEWKLWAKALKHYKNNCVICLLHAE